MLKRLFLYIEPLWIGTNNKISIRRVLSLIFSFNFVLNTSHIIYQWEIGKSYSDVAMILGIEAGLIAALLSLTTYSSAITQKKDTPVPENPIPPAYD
jgi:hypothetical protein